MTMSCKFARPCDAEVKAARLGVGKHWGPYPYYANGELPPFHTYHVAERDGSYIEFAVLGDGTAIARWDSGKPVEVRCEL